MSQQQRLITRNTVKPELTTISTATTILESQLRSKYQKPTSEQRPPVNNGHKLWVVVHRFDCNSEIFLSKSKDGSDWEQDIWGGSTMGHGSPAQCHGLGQDGD